MALSHVVSEIFDVEKYRDLEITVRGQSRSLKVVPFNRDGYGTMVSTELWFPISLFAIVTLSVRCTVSYSNVKCVAWSVGS